MGVFEQFAALDKKGKTKFWKRIQADCAMYPAELVQVPVDLERFEESQRPKEVWRSRGFVVQIYEINDQVERMTINRNAFTPDFTRFLDGIPWERIQKLKEECGRGDLEACEIYPKNSNIVNVANLRHVWILKSGTLSEQYGIGWVK